jgi:hypothetical protein
LSEKEREVNGAEGTDNLPLIFTADEQKWEERIHEAFI